MEKQEFFDYAEEEYKRVFKLTAKEHRKNTEAENRHIAGRSLLINETIFNNIKSEYIDEFVELYPIDWTRFSELKIFTEKQLRKYSKHLAFSKIFTNYPDVSESFKNDFKNKLGIVNRVVYQLITEQELIELYPEQTISTKKKIKRLLEEHPEIYHDGIRLFIEMQ